jgi:hypothetical protein
MSRDALQAMSVGKSLRVNSINLALFLVAVFINVVSYHSFAPILIAIFFFILFYALLCLPLVGGIWERRIFNRIFTVGLLMAGIAAIYTNQLEDPSQLFGDANSFFEISSTSPLRDLPLIELRSLHEGGLAIKIWATAYDFFSIFGFNRDRYIGISINICTVALTAVVALKMTRLVFGFDPVRFKLLMLFFSACGLFWLFSSIHLRDSIILLLITTLVYVWLYFLQKPVLGCRLLFAVAASFLASTFLGFLRGWFAYLPIGIAIIAIVVLFFSAKSSTKFNKYILLFIGLAIVTELVLTFGEDVKFILSQGKDVYAQLNADQSSTNSLGTQLILNQPIFMRLLLGSIYLFIFPIPFWNGFQLESVYNLFKSFNVIFFYLLLPLHALAVVKIWKDKSTRTPSILFLFCSSFVFIVMIAGTSLETRHLGVFLPLLFMLALIPDLRVRSVRNLYKKLLISLLFVVTALHLLWALLKL